MNNTTKLAPVIIVASVFAAVPLAAYVALLLALIGLVTFKVAALAIIAKLFIVTIWVVGMLPVAIRVCAMQFMVGFAEAARFFDLRSPTKDADGNTIPVEGAK